MAFNLEDNLRKIREAARQKAEALKSASEADVKPDAIKNDPADIFPDGNTNEALPLVEAPDNLNDGRELEKSDYEIWTAKIDEVYGILMSRLSLAAHYKQINDEPAYNNYVLEIDSTHFLPWRNLGREIVKLPGSDEEPESLFAKVSEKYDGCNLKILDFADKIKAAAFGENITPPQELEETNVVPVTDRGNSLESNLNPDIDDEVQEQELLEPQDSVMPSMEDLNKAREAYFRAKQKQFGFLNVLKLVLSKDSREKVGAEIRISKENYESLRAEFVGLSVDNFLFEQQNILDLKIKLHEEKLKQRDDTMGASWKLGMKIEKGFNRFHEAAGKYGLEKLFSPKALSLIDKVTFPAKTFSVKGKNFNLPDLHIGKAFVKGLNCRTAITLGLLGVGFVFGAGSVVGLAALAGRRVIAGASAAKGTRVLADQYFESRDQQKYQYGNTEGSYTTLGKKLASLESKGLLAGRSMDEIVNDPVYKELHKRFAEEMRLDTNYFEQHYSPEDLADLISDRFGVMERQADGELSEKMNERLRSRLISAFFGLSVYVGAWAKLFGHKTALINKPNAAGGATDIHSGGGSGNHMGGGSENNLSGPLKETPGRSLTYPPTSEIKKVIFSGNVGSSGIEGSIFSLKRSNPEQYQKMLGWLQEHYSVKGPAANNSSGKLIHRFILDYADKHNMSVGDNGPRDLNKIIRTGFDIKANGELDLKIDPDADFVAPVKQVLENGQTMQPPEVADSNNVAEAVPVQTEIINSEQAEVVTTQPEVPVDVPVAVPKPVVENYTDLVMDRVSKIPDTSKALMELLGNPTKYNRLLDYITPSGMKSAEFMSNYVDHAAGNMNILDLSRQIGSDKNFSKIYGQLGKVAQNIMRFSSDIRLRDNEYLKTLTVKTFLLKYAPTYLERH